MTEQIDKLMELVEVYAQAIHETSDVDRLTLHAAIGDALKKCRDTALEEAAKVCESFSEECSFEITHADEIRKLKSTITKFKTIDDLLSYIKKTHWHGLEHVPGRKNAIDILSTETGIRNQYDKSLSGEQKLFFFVQRTIDSYPAHIWLEVLSATIESEK